jgi:hypothetical protein
MPRPQTATDSADLITRGTEPLHARLAVGIVVLAALGVLLSAQDGVRTPEPSLLARFFSRTDPSPDQYRALRHLEARNDRFGVAGWMNVWTESDSTAGFRYQIVNEGGSHYVCNRVLRAALEGERNIWASDEPERAALTEDNYLFEERGTVEPGVALLAVKPKRKDMLLVEGSLFVNATDADLLRIEGRLSKTPSFWTRRVDVVRRYERIAGVRVPVAFESVANVLVAGRSTFRMTYEYESINGIQVGSPQVPQ